MMTHDGILVSQIAVSQPPNNEPPNRVAARITQPSERQPGQVSSSQITRIADQRDHCSAEERKWGQLRDEIDHDIVNNSILPH